MIRHFQEMYFDSRYAQTIASGNYFSCNLRKISEAYNIPFYEFSDSDFTVKHVFDDMGPCLVEISLPEETYVIPKLAVGKPNTDQEPPLDRVLYRKLMDL